jgi:hypothetical protein
MKHEQRALLDDARQDGTNQGIPIREFGGGPDEGWPSALRAEILLGAHSFE